MHAAGVDTALPQSQADAAQPSTRAWLAVISVTICTFAMTTSTFLPVGLLTELAADFNVTNGTAGLMVMIPSLSAAIAAPIMVITVGLLDRRRVICWLTALLFASNMVVALAPVFAVALGGRVLLGICIGGVWSFATSTGRRLVSEPNANRAMAIILAGISIGTVCGVPAGTLLGSLAGWRIAFAATGILATIAVTAQVSLLPKLPPSEAIRPHHLLLLFQAKMARVGIIAVMILTAGHFVAHTYRKPFLQTVGGMDKNTITVVLLIYGVAGFVGTFIGATAAARNVLSTYLGVALLLGVSVLFSAYVGSSKPAAIILVAIWGLAFGALPVCAQMWMFKAAPTAFEGGLALFVSAFQLAVAIGSLVGGIIVDHEGVSGAMIAGGAISIVAAGFLWSFGRTHSI